MNSIPAPKIYSAKAFSASKVEFALPLAQVGVGLVEGLLEAVCFRGGDFDPIIHLGTFAEGRGAGSIPETEVQRIHKLGLLVADRRSMPSSHPSHDLPMEVLVLFVGCSDHGVG